MNYANSKKGKSLNNLINSQIGTMKTINNKTTERIYVKDLTVLATPININGESKMTNLANELQEMFSRVEMDNNAKTAIIKSVILKVENAVSLTTLQEKLKVLYEYEKNYLELIKAYKEEIKFAATLQEDLRKERTKFFSESLKEVSTTLKESQVDSNVASIWIKELVNSYTKSLDLSSGLIEEHTIDMIGEIRQKAKQESEKIKNNNE